MKDGLDDVRQILTKYETYLKNNYSNVTLVAVGYKCIGGVEKKEPCLVIYVKKKLPKDKLDPKDIIPEMIESIPTDIRESDGAIFHGYR